MTLAYTARLNFKVQSTNVRAQKIDSSIFKIFKIVRASFQVDNKFGQALFSQETFLVADTNIQVIMGMFILIFSIAEILFAD